MLVYIKTKFVWYLLSYIVVFNIKIIIWMRTIPFSVIRLLTNMEIPKWLIRDTNIFRFNYELQKLNSWTHNLTTIVNTIASISCASIISRVFWLGCIYNLKIYAKICLPNRITLNCIWQLCWNSWEIWITDYLNYLSFAYKKIHEQNHLKRLRVYFGL